MMKDVVRYIKRAEAESGCPSAFSSSTAIIVMQHQRAMRSVSSTDFNHINLDPSSSTSREFPFIVLNIRAK